MIERDLSAGILPAFDYLVTDLSKMLEIDSRESGETFFCNIPGGLPSIYSSDLVKNGIIVNGTNSMGIGTNSAWEFSISSTVDPVTLDDLNRIQGRFASINVASQTTNGESLLTVFADDYGAQVMRMFETNGNRRSPLRITNANGRISLLRVTNYCFRKMGLIWMNPYHLLPRIIRAKFMRPLAA
jgi:hypothetical protein